jgi:hypothetical protein
MKRSSLIVLVLFLLLVRPTVAQDATVDPAPIAIVTQEAAGHTTVEDGGTVINIEAPAPTETPAPVSDNSPLATLAVIAAGFVGIIVALSYGFQAIGNRAQAAVNNPLEIAVLEKAHDSIPASFVQTIIDPLQAALERTTEALVNVTALLKEAGDKTPKASKPLPDAAPLANNPTITSIHDAGGSTPQDAEF